MKPPKISLPTSMGIRFILFSISLCLVIDLLVHASDSNNHEIFRRDIDSKIKDKTPKKASFEKKTDIKNTAAKQKILAKDPMLSSESVLPSSVVLPNPSDLNITYDDDDDDFNTTQPESTKVDNHRYFTSTMITDPTEAKKLWIDFSTLPKHQTFIHDVLSKSHRRAASITLPFVFPFYGNNITRTTITTGGFLYMGEHVHSWLAATQYIAPLMSNFDNRNSSNGLIRYGYNSSVFVIQWEQVRLQESPINEFTFQCALHINGDIVFAYKDIPVPITDIIDSSHPVKIGVSDAYFINRHQVFIRRKTIYEYHKVDLMNHNETISNNTAIYLKALPTCITLKTCDACLTSKIQFDCVWCPAVQRCSDGYDRQRQEWIAKHCDSDNVHNMTQCAAIPTTTTVSSVSISTTDHMPSTASTPLNNSTTIHSTVISSDQTGKSVDLHNDKNLTQLEYNTHEQRIGPNMNSKVNQKSRGHGSSFAMTLFFLFSIVAGVGLWVFYAYRNPTSSSGQLLIRWRPSAWRWNSAETRYTAASIHM